MYTFLILANRQIKVYEINKATSRISFFILNPCQRTYQSKSSSIQLSKKGVIIGIFLILTHNIRTMLILDLTTLNFMSIIFYFEPEALEIWGSSRS
jgi:hypothetical protein